MKRREFITLFGGAAAAAWPLAARGQQRRRIGVLMPFNPGDREAEAPRAVFEQSLDQLGWALGQNVHIDYRLTGSAVESISRHAAELVALAPDVIVTAGALAPGNRRAQVASVGYEQGVTVPSVATSGSGSEPTFPRGFADRR